MRFFQLRIILKNSVFLRALGAISRAKNFHHRQAPSTDVRSTVERALRSAGAYQKPQGFADIGATIEQALSAAGLARRPDATNSEPAVATVLGSSRQQALPGLVPPVAPSEHSPAGEFVCRSFTGRAGARAYKLYVPSCYGKESSHRMPLVVMLHGCTQSATDFAAGTGMNALAEEQGFLVAYPEQETNANPSRCWNWFRSGDQVRDSGEPSLIAGITRAIASDYRVDERRIYVAGLSAGAAMAVILGATYPDLYAAVGAHSGLSYGSAHDIPSAFAAMKNGGTRDPSRHRKNLQHQGVEAVPTIVFHGDNDSTVTSRNAKAIVDQAIDARGAANVLVTSDEGIAAGQRYTRTVYAAGASTPFVEHWTIRGGGHAWSGGNSQGSYVDVRGPNASAEMIRFFNNHVR